MTAVTFIRNSSSLSDQRKGAQIVKDNAPLAALSDIPEAQVNAGGRG